MLISLNRFNHEGLAPIIDTNVYSVRSSPDVDDKVVAEVASMTDYIPEQAARMCAIA